MKVAWSGERAVERNDCVQGILGKSSQLNLSTEAEKESWMVLEILNGWWSHLLRQS